MYGEGKSYKEDKDTFVCFLPAGILIVRYQIPIRIQTILVCILWLLVMLFLLKMTAGTFRLMTTSKKNLF